MATRIALIVCTVSMVFLYGRATPCAAGEATDQVRAILNRVISIQTDPRYKGPESRNQRRLAIKEVIGRSFNFDAMATQALDLHWAKLTEAQRQEFKTVFQDLFQESYTKLVLDFLKEEKIVYAKEEPLKDRTAVTTVIMRANEDIPVDYSLSPVNGKWLVDDVKIDGVSIVQNYRKSFSRLIQQESFESLLKKMKFQQQTTAR
jgi:phospholipid transport system substrate-binding protein